MRFVDQVDGYGLINERPGAKALGHAVDGSHAGCDRAQYGERTGRVAEYSRKAHVPLSSGPGRGHEIVFIRGTFPANLALQLWFAAVDHR